MNTYERAEFILLARELRRALDRVDKLMMLTPTSEKRSKLTEANIHLMSAVRTLGEIE